MACYEKKITEEMVAFAKKQIIAGVPNKEIANSLGLSVSTIVKMKNDFILEVPQKTTPWDVETINKWENATRPYWDIWEEWDSFVGPIRDLIERLKYDKSRKKASTERSV